MLTLLLMGRFGILNRLAGIGRVMSATPDGGADEAADVVDPRFVARRPFASGLLVARWTTPRARCRGGTWPGPALD